MVLNCKNTKNLYTAQETKAFFLNKDFNNFYVILVWKGYVEWANNSKNNLLKMNVIKEKLIINYKKHLVVLFFFLFLQVQNYVDGNEVDFKPIG